MRPTLGLPGLSLGKPPRDGLRDVRGASRTGQHAPDLFGLADDLLVSTHGSMLIDVRAHGSTASVITMATGGVVLVAYDGLTQIYPHRHRDSDSKIA